MDTSKTDLIGLRRDEMAETLVRFSLDPCLVKPLWHWLYHGGITCFSKMGTLSRIHQARLAEHFYIGRPTLIRELVSADGTKKWLLQVADKKSMESVLIPEKDRGALCVSSQIGCSLACTFCYTGTMTFTRNLTPSEIVSQVMNARDRLAEWGRKRRDCLLTNLVLMGTGEPLLNYDNVASALRVIMDPEGIGISRRRIMLSTAGVVPIISRVGTDLGINLAISLHAVTDELRDALVPLNRKYPLRELMQVCRDYPAASNARRITFEYVMLDGVNDSDAEARELVRLLNGIHAKVNLIPWNPWPGTVYRASSEDRIQAFAQIVKNGGYSSAVRATRGGDIMAACGQLKSEYEPGF